MTSSARRPGPLVCLLAGLVLLAGCGGTSSTEGGGPDPDAAATATGGAPAPTASAPTASAPTASAPTASAPTASAPTASAPTASAPAAPAGEVASALRFTARTVGGRAFEGADLAGRPVVLWFWAPWCSVCRRQSPEVERLAATYGDRVAFVGVGSLAEAEAVRDFAATVPGPVHLSDVDGDLYRRFRIAEQSSFVVLDPQGREVLRTGYDDEGRLAEVVADVAG